MSVKIRLRRTGTTNKPFYRVVVADGRSPIKGRFIENVGWYDPKKRGTNYSLEMERIEYWSGKGAQMSDTVRSLVKQCRLAPTKSEEPSAPPVEETPAEATELAEAAAAETAADEPDAEEDETPKA